MDIHQYHNARFAVQVFSRILTGRAVCKSSDSTLAIHLDAGSEIIHLDETFQGPIESGQRFGCDYFVNITDPSARCC